MVHSPEQSVLKLYELLSGPANHERPWDEITALFLPEARLSLEQIHDDGSVRSGSWTVAEFSQNAAEHYREYGFWETELHHKVESFGNIAHIFSTYESRIGDPSLPPMTRGINSVQLLCRQGQWLIAGLVFYMEQPSTPIPSKYLPSIEKLNNT